MEFKDKLKKLRTDRGISQQALADAIFVSRSAVAKWENGLGYPNEESLTALQKYFGVDGDYFITKEPETVIVEKNRKIRTLNIQFIAIALAVLMVAGFVLPGVEGFMKLEAIVFHGPLENHALELLADPPEVREFYWGFRVDVYPGDGAVFFEGPWGYHGLLYSAGGEPVGYQGTQMDFYDCGRDWYWAEEEGDNWMHVERIIGNLFWYDMHF